MIQDLEPTFKEFDESAYSIVPSQLLTVSDRYSITSLESTKSLRYFRLSFEASLSTARVYKRNYRNRRLSNGPVSEKDNFNGQSAHPSITNPNPSTSVSGADPVTESISQQSGVDVLTTSIPAEIDETLTRTTGPPTQSPHPDQIDCELRWSQTSRKTPQRESSVSTQWLSAEYVSAASTDTQHSTFANAGPSSIKDFVEGRLRLWIAELASHDNSVPKLQRLVMDFCERISLGNSVKVEAYVLSFRASQNCTKIQYHMTMTAGMAIAVANGQCPIIWIPMENGALLDGGTDWLLCTPLHFAIMANQVEAALLLMGKGADVAALDSFGNSSLHLACRNGWKYIVVALVRHGATIHDADRKGRKPLHVVSNDNDGPEIIRYLVDHGAYLGKVDNDGNSALHLACHNKRFRKIQALLSCRYATMGYDVFLASATMCCLTELIESLLSSPGVELLIDAYQGHAKSMLSRVYGYKYTRFQEDIFSHIVAARGNLRACVITTGDYSLHRLLDHALLDEQDMSERGYQQELLDLWLSAGAQLNVLNNDGDTPVFLAAKHLNHDAIEIILRHPECPSKGLI